MTRLTITRPDDWHLHLRDGDAMRAVLPFTAERFGRATAYTLANPDFVRLGEAFGMRALRLASSDEIGPALAAALAGDQSTLLEVPLELRPPRDFYA